VALFWCVDRWGELERPAFSPGDVSQ
jgi:hypothetical protein